jgi:hypothetical protein
MWRISMTQSADSDTAVAVHALPIYSVQKSDEEWRAQLSPEQFRILRKKGTEMAGTGEYDKQVRR